jgi:hypothetical protein
VYRVGLALLRNLLHSADFSRDCNVRNFRQRHGREARSAKTLSFRHGATVAPSPGYGDFFLGRRLASARRPPMVGHGCAPGSIGVLWRLFSDTLVIG